MDIISELLKEQKHIFNFCFRLCGNGEDAKDLLQDTNVKIILKRDLYNPRLGRFESWAMNVAHNTFIDQIRKNKKSIVRPFSDYLNPDFDQLPLKIKHIQSSEKSDAQVQYSQLQKIYITAIYKVPYKCSKTFEKNRAGYSYEEIVQMEGINMNTVKTRIHRARKLLQKEMGLSILIDIKIENIVFQKNSQRSYEFFNLRLFHSSIFL